MSSQLKYHNPNGHKAKQRKRKLRFIRTDTPIAGVECRKVLPPIDPEADRIRNVIRDSMDFNRNCHLEAVYVWGKNGYAFLGMREKNPAT